MPGWGGGAVLNVVLGNSLVRQGSAATTQMTYTPLWLPLFALVTALKYEEEGIGYSLMRYS